MTKEGKDAANTAILMSLDDEIDKRVAQAMVRIFEGTALDDNKLQLAGSVIGALSQSPLLGTLMMHPNVKLGVVDIIKNRL
jgi:hypothetical protein